MKFIPRISVLALLAALLPAGITFSQGAGAITGTVFAASGHDLSNAVVIACFVANDTCDDKQSKAVAVSGKGSSAPYKLEGLSSASYLMIAWRDLNNSGEVDASDEIGVYSQDGKTPSLVKPPAQKIDLRLQAFDGDTDKLFSSPQAQNPPAPNPPASSPSASGAIPPELVGIWKGVDVPAEYRNVATGAFAGLSGWYGQLKLRADGRYEFEEYREGQISNCRVTILTRSDGTATTRGTELALSPSDIRETLSNTCDRSKSYQNKPIKPAPARYTWSLSSTETLFGYRTLKLTLQPPGGGFPDVFERVDGAALPSNPPRFPANAELRNDPLPAELAATWSWPATARLDFYNPTSGAFTSPGSSLAWLRLLADGRFELTAFSNDLVPGPGCKKNAMLFERGQYQFTAGDYNNNYLVLQPQVSTLIESLSECGADNGSRKRSLPLEPQFFYASLGRTVNNEEVFEIRCSSRPEERSEWQFLICPSSGSDFRQLYSRRR
jgi:hypothetical protein